MTISFIPSFISVVLLCCAWAPPALAQKNQNLPLRGINLAGGGFAERILSGKHGKEYRYPTAEEVDMYANFGMRIIRLSFLWERVQPDLKQPFDRAQEALIDAVVNEAASKNVFVILDLHNYGAFRKNLIGSGDVPVAAFADFWTRMAVRYKDQPYIIFGLMNEPHAHNAEEWAAIAQEGIIAIRKTGATQAIFVPGTKWSAAHKWLLKDGKMSNGEALKGLKDPLRNIVFEAHMYFDGDSSGRHRDCVSETIGAERLAPFTGWLRENHFRGFLGEFGSSQDPTCLAALTNTLSYMDRNADVWMGWTLWAASARFGKYMFNVYPPDTEKIPQARVLKNFIDLAK